MKISITKQERELFSLIRKVSVQLNIPIYVIGGFVRDKILKRPSKDLDFVCLGDGTLFAQELIKHITPNPKLTIFQRFGTAMFRYKDFELEFVGARKESYSRDSRNPVVEPGTLEDDQNRRDFTINAMGIHIAEDGFENVVDPFGGIDHLKMGLIKTPLNPDKTFSDDPLRMMRAIRFASQLDFHIDTVTFDSIKSNAHRLEIVAKERIIDELNKIVMSPKPSIGFKLLFDSGLLGVFFKEMTELYGVDVVDNKGHKDNFYHTIEVLDNLSQTTNDLWLRWAAIMHDIAKPVTKRYDKKQGWTFHGHEVVGAAWVPRIFKRLGLPLDHKMKYVKKLVRLHLRPISLTNENITDSAIRRLLYDAGDDIDDLMLLCQADITSKNKTKVERYKSNYEMVKQKLVEVEEKDQIRNWQPPISGEVIMKTFGLKPSKEVGILKNAIREAILEGEIPNEYQAAFNYMKLKATELDLNTKDQS